MFSDLSYPITSGYITLEGEDFHLILVTQIAPNHNIITINTHFLKAFEALNHRFPGIVSSIAEKHALNTFIGPINVTIEIEVATKTVVLGSELVD